MRLAPTTHGASRLVQAMPSWSVKTRHAPSRHCRNARVYGHTTTAMHEMPPTPPSPYYIGWVGVGWQRHCQTCRSLREPDTQGTASLFFGGRSQLVVELDRLCEVNNLYSAQVGMIVSRTR